MDGTIGVLLGITMTVVAVACYLGWREAKEIREELGFAYEANTDTRTRLKALEKRNNATVEPQTAKASQLRPRTWSEDMGAAEAK